VNYRVGTGPDRLDISLQNDAQVKQEGRLKGFPTIWHTSLYTKPGTWEHIEIYVNNLAPVTAALKAAGVEMEVSGSHVWTHDPDGALLQITDGPDH
jgi:catechol 2,3-dioxygenase-like lactoylglutathione lyase family enzyme